MGGIVGSRHQSNGNAAHAKQRVPAPRLPSRRRTAVVAQLTRGLDSGAFGTDSIDLFKPTDEE
jgi:hypothetical protein